MTYAALALHVDGGVAELRLDREATLNAFDETLVDELPLALAELGRQRDVRAVVWTSTGKHFSAGGDMDTILAGHADHDVLLSGIDAGRRLYRAFADFPKPLVVALHGHVFGVGTSLVLTGDAIVTTPTAKLSDPHVHMGLVAGDGGCVSWPANVGLVRAKRQLLWGEPLTGQQAYDLGMVTELEQNPEAVRDTAFALATRVAALPPVAVQLTKRTLNRAFAARVDEVLDTGFYLEAISNRTADTAEAVAAFRDKRPPNWSGR